MASIIKQIAWLYGRVKCLTEEIQECCGLNTGNRILSGNLRWDTGYRYQVVGLTYEFEGSTYEIPTTLLTFSPPIEGLSRQDVVYVNSQGQLGILEGESALISAEPILNESIQLKFTVIDINSVTSNSQSNKILTGGYISWSGGFTHFITPLTYIIQNDSYASLGGSVTFTDSDATYNRKDALVVDTNGDLIIITGVPSEIPAEPVIDELLYCLISYVSIPANSTVIENVAQEVVYRENAGDPTEWETSTDSLLIAFEDNTFPNNGVNCIIQSEENIAASLKSITFKKPSTVTFSDYTALEFYIRLDKAVQNNDYLISISMTVDGETAVDRHILLSGNSNYDQTLAGEYQRVVIPMEFFTNVPAEFDSIIFTFTDGYHGVFRLDDISLVSGIGTPPTSVNTYLTLEDTDDINYSGKQDYVPQVNQSESGLILVRKYWIRVDNNDISADLHKAEGNRSLGDIEDGDIVRSAIFKSSNIFLPYGEYDSGIGLSTDIDSYIIPLMFN